MRTCRVRKVVVSISPAQVGVLGPTLRTHTLAYGASFEPPVHFAVHVLGVINLSGVLLLRFPDGILGVGVSLGSNNDVVSLMPSAVTQEATQPVPCGLILS